jgi:hypothetical protein
MARYGECCKSESNSWYLRVLSLFLASNVALVKGGGMRRDELLKTDLLSEIVLLGSSVAILVSFAVVVVAALTSTALQ